MFPLLARKLGNPKLLAFREEASLHFVEPFPEDGLCGGRGV